MMDKVKPWTKALFFSAGATAVVTNALISDQYRSGMSNQGK